MKLSEIALLTGGELSGDDVDIRGVADLDNQKEGDIAWALQKKNIEILAASCVSALILPRGTDYHGKPAVFVDDPKAAFSKVLELFNPYKPFKVKIFPDVYIEPTAIIGKGVTIMPFTAVMDKAVIGDGTVIYSQVFIGKNVKIGKNCIIKAGVKIDDETVIGDHVIIHHNTVVGGDGFGYIQKDGKNIKINQIGRIIIEDDVEIGACTAIDRATIGETVIGSGTKIDNLVQISHNVKIGENSILAGQVGVAGSSTVGRNNVLLGQVGLGDHVELGNNVIVMAQSGVEEKKVPDNSVLFGYPAKPFMETRRTEVYINKLADLFKRVKELEKK